MKLTIIAVGSLKDSFFREACAEYSKRMGAMRPVEIIEVQEEPIADEKERSLIAKALEREGRRILNLLRPGDLSVALTPTGQTMDSEGFAGAIEPRAYPEYKRLVFIIGSSHGLGPAILERCRWKLSFGPMTYPHQLARLMLLEQIYRAQMISAGRAYHK